EEPPQNEVPPYDFDRLTYEIRPCDVLLIEGRSRISRVIRSITQSPWTHAALYIGRLRDIEDEDLRKTLKEYGIEKEKTHIIIEGIINRGTVASALTTYRSTHIRICRPIGLSAADANVIIAYAIKSLGKTYSIRQILDLGRFFLPWSILPRSWGSSLFRTPTGKPEEGVCSSLIAEAFSIVQFPVLPFVEQNKEGLELIQRNPYLYTPKDFDYSPYFEIIKYPLFNPEEPLPYYRRLPWTKENVVYQDSYGKYTRSEGKLIKQEKAVDKAEDEIEEKPTKPTPPSPAGSAE
ncbi:MAG TPA: hypothetical protein VHA13_00005, partial [Gammaproteobacteria bacterium]|nr:hypothetical protein [Gammaproteobacteria bacterium]